MQSIRKKKSENARRGVLAEEKTIEVWRANTKEKTIGATSSILQQGGWYKAAPIDAEAGKLGGSSKKRRAFALFDEGAKGQELEGGWRIFGCPGEKQEGAKKIKTPGGRNPWRGMTLGGLPRGLD